MSIIKGKKLRVMISGSVVAKATSCTVTINGNTSDISTKDDPGLSTMESITSKSWQVQVDSLDETNITSLLTAWKNQTKLTIGWDEWSGTNNNTRLYDNLNRSGEAYLTDATFTFNDREIVATNITFTGTGQLTRQTS